MGYLIHHITQPEVQGQVFKFFRLKTTLDALVRSLIDITLRTSYRSFSACLTNKVWDSLLASVIIFT
jgi:hypothetical protein